MTMNPRELRDVTYSDDPADLKVDRVRKVAQQIVDVLRDPGMHHSIPTRVARAVAERRISADELAAVLDYIAARKRDGDNHPEGPLRSPGAYFVVSMRRVFAAAGVPWKEIKR